MFEVGKAKENVSQEVWSRKYDNSRKCDV